MDLTKEIAQCIDALRVANSASLYDLLQRSQTALEKLEQDRKVLRWALLQAREAISGGTPFYSQTLLSIIDTAKNMTEPANDR